MNWIDILLVLILLFSFWGGLQKGFLLGFLDLVSLVGSVFIAFLLYPYLTGFIETSISSLGAWARPVAFLIVLFTARAVFGFLSTIIIREVPERAHDNAANRFLGLLPGGVNGLINATLLSAILLALPLWPAVSETARQSEIVSRLSLPAEWLESKVSPVFNDAVRKSMNRITVEPGSEESVTLPFKVNSTKVREDLERRMLELVNEERSKAGLKPVNADPEMTQVARKHSVDMFARGYFSHVTPDGLDPFDRMRESGVKFLTAGENLALAQTLQIAHTGLMNSPGHRANILRPQFGRLGIGIIDGGIYGLMVTQKFRN